MSSFDLAPRAIRRLLRLDNRHFSCARHFGPMAEEFSAAYGLGESAAKVAPADRAGVALASTKALRAENVELLKRELSLIRDQFAEFLCKD